MSLTETDPILIFLGVLLTLILIVLLVIIAVVVRNAPGHADRHITNELNKAADRFGQSVRHHAEVNAVLGVMDAFTERPDLIDHLGPYADQVVAAAIMTRLNAIATDITNVTNNQTKLEEELARGRMPSTNPPLIAKNRQKLGVLQDELQALHDLAQKYGLPLPT